MMGSLLLPTFSNSHHQGAGFHGSPVEAKARREERSWRQTVSSLCLPLRLCDFAGGLPFWREPPRQPKRLPSLLRKEGSLARSPHVPLTPAPVSARFLIPRLCVSRRIPTCGRASGNRGLRRRCRWWRRLSTLRRSATGPSSSRCPCTSRSACRGPRPSRMPCPAPL